MRNLSDCLTILCLVAKKWGGRSLPSLPYSYGSVLCVKLSSFTNHKLPLRWSEIDMMQTFGEAAYGVVWRFIKYLFLGHMTATGTQS